MARKTDEEKAQEQAAAMVADGEIVTVDEPVAAQPQTRRVKAAIGDGPEGGRYVVDGRVVDANGQPVED